MLNIDFGGKGADASKKEDPKNLKLSIVERGWQKIIIFIYAPYPAKQWFKSMVRLDVKVLHPSPSIADHRHVMVGVGTARARRAGS